MQLGVGEVVRIFGLTSDKGRELNGREATVLTVGDRCHVELAGGDAVSVRNCNLVRAGEYDSDDGWNVGRVAKRQRTEPGSASSSGSSSTALAASSAAPSPAGVSEEGAVWLVLSSYSFPEGCACVANAPIAAAFRSLEKFEVSVQCDDDASEERHFNSEALLYSRAAAVAAGVPFPLSQWMPLGKSGFVARAAASLPFFGPFRALQAYQILSSGSCEALAKFESGRPPTGSDNALRLKNEAGRSMGSAPEKRQLGKVFGLGAKTAIDLVEAAGRFDGLTPVRSVPSLLQSPQHLAKLGGDKRAGSLLASLRHFDELQEPVSEAEALEMRRHVLSVVRSHHSARAGERRDCPPPPAGGGPCRCCWHADFMGGSRTRGRAGHDVDLLLWHATEPNSWGEGEEACVLLPLLRELLLPAGGATGPGLLPKEEARLQLVRRPHAEKQRRDADGARAYLPRRKAAAARDRGSDILHGDWHDKAYGIWRNTAGRHRRIDIVVVAFPDELPYARLNWTGSRTLNRLLRHRAIQLGLHLTANGLTAHPPTGRGRQETTVVLDARPGRERVEVALVGHAPVPDCTSEEEVLRVLAGGTDAFAGIYDPLMRNA
mmetsp:Transcript_35040/g.110475  ORF Transcript_35040/g.110475 Transcript_35040/m.110475 type:complete len:603 (+) Transcript_35040:75-1883(+)